jgi:hypothetical protein
MNTAEYAERRATLMHEDVEASIVRRLRPFRGLHLTYPPGSAAGAFQLRAYAMGFNDMPTSHSLRVAADFKRDFRGQPVALKILHSWLLLRGI